MGRIQDLVSARPKHFYLLKILALAYNIMLGLHLIPALQRVIVTSPLLREKSTSSLSTSLDFMFFAGKVSEIFAKYPFITQLPIAMTKTIFADYLVQRFVEGEATNVLLYLPDS